MLKQQAKLLRKIAIITDFIAINAAFALACHVRHLGSDLVSLKDYSWVLLPVVPVWYFLLNHFGFYASLRTRSFLSILASLTKIQTIGGIVTSSVIYFVEPHGFSRALFGEFLVFSYLFLLLEKSILKAGQAYLRKRGYNTRNILIVGTNGKSREFINLLEKHTDWGLKVVGFLQVADEPAMTTVSGYNVLGRIENHKQICRFYSVDEVVFCLPMKDMVDVDDILRDMEETGVTVRMMLSFFENRGTRKELSIFQNQIPFLTFYSKPFNSSQLFLKRCLDIFGALIGLSITALFFPVIALSVRIDSRGPIFFGQRRVGESGRLFKCWKFRTMYTDAEERKKELLSRNEMNGAMFKIKNDPRITRVGKFLRRTSMDELPQFWNVLKGEMSLVGTRPPTPDEVTRYENWHRKRICIKPGITGFWQVNGRSQIQDFDKIVRLDLEYIDRWTLWLDIILLFRTVWVVCAGRGAR